MAEYYGGVEGTGLGRTSTVTVGPFKSGAPNDRKVTVNVLLGVYRPPRVVDYSWGVTSRTKDVTYSSTIESSSGSNIVTGNYSQRKIEYKLYFPQYKKGQVSYADVKGTINGRTALVRFTTQYETRVSRDTVDVDGNYHEVDIGLVDTAGETIKKSGVPSWITVEGSKLKIAENTSSARSATLTFEGSSQVTVSVLQGKAVGISASPSNIRVGQRGGTTKVTLEITGAGVSVATAKSDSTWVTSVDTSGNITYDRNPNKKSRTAIITYTGTKDGVKKGEDTVTLVQSGSKEIQVYCNRTGVVSTSSNETWITVSGNVLSETTVTASKSGTGKTGSVTLRGENGGSATLTVNNQIP